MTPIFLDADVFLDVFSERSPWYHSCGLVESRVTKAEGKQLFGLREALCQYLK